MEEILSCQKPVNSRCSLPISVQDEIAHPNTPAEVKRKAKCLLFSVPVQLTELELATHQRIRSMVRGNSQVGRHDKDAFHVVESAKNGGIHFITNDRRLLKKAREIWRELAKRILKPSEFIEDYYTRDAL